MLGQGALGWDERVLFHFTEHGLVQCQLVFKLKAVTQLLQSKVDLWADAQACPEGQLWCPRGRVYR